MFYTYLYISNHFIVQVSARTASSTSAACPGTFTLCQTRRTTPCASIRKVQRSIPIYFRPYMLFSTQAPYRSTTSPSLSEASLGERPYLVRNLPWLAAESLETPTTTAPAAAKASAAAVNACASAVHPEVSSLG